MGAVGSVEVVTQHVEVVRDVHHVVKHTFLHGQKDVLRRQLEPGRQQRLGRFIRAARSGGGRGDKQGQQQQQLQLTSANAATAAPAARSRREAPTGRLPIVDWRAAKNCKTLSRMNSTRYHATLGF